MMERIKPPVVRKVKSVRKIMRPLTGCDSKPPLHQWDYRALLTGLTSGGTSRHSIAVDGGGWFSRSTRPHWQPPSRHTPVNNLKQQMGNRGPDSQWVKEFNTGEVQFYLIMSIDRQLTRKSRITGFCPRARASLCSARSIDSSFHASASLAHGLCKGQRVCACVHVYAQQQQWSV